MNLGAPKGGSPKGLTRFSLAFVRRWVKPGQSNFVQVPVDQECDADLAKKALEANLAAVAAQRSLAGAGPRPTTRAEIRRLLEGHTAGSS